MEKMEINSSSQIISNFWKGKKVLITGHTGFKGSWLSLWMQMMDVNLAGIALNPITQPSLFNEAKISSGMTSINGDIRNFDLVLETFEKYKPEIVFHLAAQPLVRYSYDNPRETYETNVMGTINIFEAVRKVNSVKVLVNVTSDKCYENKEINRGYKEDEQMGGDDPYSSSKGCSELITGAYRRSFFLNSGVGVASARGGNVIGGGDWSKDRLVPDILRSFDKKEAVIIRNPYSIRPWQHVLDLLSGYILLAQKLSKDHKKFSGAWNFGPNHEDAKTVKWITEFMIKKSDNGTKWSLDKNINPHEAGSLMLDISKAKNFLHWYPKLSIDQALEKVLDWQYSWVKTNEVQKICKKQILEFVSLT